jgi:CBS domain containing-hemolysin-like protein
MDLGLVWRLLAVLLLVAANAFFVAAEFALVSARPTRIKELKEAGDWAARAVERAQRNLDLSISGTQLGITLASLGLGWIGEPAVARTLAGLFEGLGSPWASVATHGVATAVAFAFITFLHIVLGELAPKSVAILHPVNVSRAVATPLNIFNTIARPAIWVLNGSSLLFLRMFGVRATSVSHRVHSPREIRMLVTQSQRGGAVDSDEEAMIHGVFELTQTVVREVMTPRTDIVAVGADAKLNEVLDIAASSGFSRLPVYRESLDDIVGVLLVKDLLGWLRSDEEAGFRAAIAAREPYFVPDTKPVDDLLTEFRHLKVHLAVVVDEFGGTDGIVTLEDLLEEIVGDIYDEHDIAETEIVEEPDGRILVAGSASLSDLLTRYDLKPDDADYDTTAGYVIGQLARIPAVGDRVALGGAELVVMNVKDRRITHLELRLPATAEDVDGETVAAVQAAKDGDAGGGS